MCLRMVSTKVLAVHPYSRMRACGLIRRRKGSAVQPHGRRVKHVGWRVPATTRGVGTMGRAGRGTFRAIPFLGGCAEGRVSPSASSSFRRQHSHREALPPPPRGVANFLCRGPGHGDSAGRLSGLLGELGTAPSSLRLSALANGQPPTARRGLGRQHVR